MHLFRIWNFIILSICLKLSDSLRYYFLKNDTKMLLSDLESADLSNVNKIVIDMIFPFYVGVVEDALLWDNIPSDDLVPKGYLMYHWLVDQAPNFACPFKSETGFECAQVARMVLIEGEDLQFEFQMNGHYTNLENYIGCFETDVSKLKVFNRSIDDCISHCKTFFFAIKEGMACLCFNNTREFNPVQLNLCSTYCQDKQFQFCGGEKYVSLYRRQESIVEVYDPSWECLYGNENCPECPSGRSGPSCELRNCLIDNGGCGEQDCQTHIFQCSECGCPTCNMSIAVCVCKKGFYINESMNCYDIDDCLNVTCDENEICVDLIGNYSCDCDKGFHRTDGSVTCEDIDECTNIPCKNNSFCENTIGSFMCTCKFGYYETVEHTCADVDECNDIWSCDQVSTDCKNLEGDYECTCKEGFIEGKAKSPKGKCDDFDECLPSRCPDGISCVNSIGSYDCLCPNGTIKRKYANLIECQDIDECIKEGICDIASSFCLNAFSFYVCVCRAGYVPVDNFTCIIDIKEQEDMETEDVLTTNSFKEESQSRFSRYISFLLGLIVFFTLNAACIYLAYLKFRRSEESSMHSADLSTDLGSID